MSKLNEDLNELSATMEGMTRPGSTKGQRLDKFNVAGATKHLGGLLKHYGETLASLSKEMEGMSDADFEKVYAVIRKVEKQIGGLKPAMGALSGRNMRRLAR